MSSSLRDLARAAGIDPDYSDWRGRPTGASDESVRMTMSALAPDLGVSNIDAPDALEQLERARWAQLVPDVVLAWDGLCIVPFSVEAKVDGQRWTQAPFPYQAKTLGWLRASYERLPPMAKRTVDALLAGTGCEPLFAVWASDSTCLSLAAISWSVRNSLPARSLGRSQGVVVALVHTPVRSGSPHGVRGIVHAFAAAGA